MNKINKLILGILAISFVLSGCTPSDQSIRNRIVKLVNKTGGSCSGEQVKAPSGKSYILTAGHCAGLADKADGTIGVMKEDGSMIRRRIIAEDPKSDLLLLEEMPGIEGLEIAQASFDTQEVRTFSHGAGFKTYITSGVIVQDTDIKILIFPIMSEEDGARCAGMPKYERLDLKIFGVTLVQLCVLNVRETTITAMSTPGSSGGAMVDSEGRLIGVISAGSDKFTDCIRLIDIKNFLAGY
jgi:hypothetical protein